ncbi:MAG: PIN domain-containing protein [Terrimicrobiaceae bacterium]|nr:PIN domain-containing protein [Terrimicrobiaceae bacterium]
MAQGTHLLDTHVVVWALEDSPLLKPRARTAIAQAGWGELAISDMTLLELAMLIRRKRVLPGMPCPRAA